MKRFKRILFIYDSERQHPGSLKRAISLAENNQADLTIFRVFDLPGESILSDDTPYARLKRSLTEEWDEQLAGIISQQPASVNITGRILFDGVFPQIIREVLRDGYDLVMKSAEDDHGFKNRIFGSTDMHLLRKCPCPVWIMNSNEKIKYQRIVAAVDMEPSAGPETMSSLNRQILEIATSLAISEFSELHIVHAWAAPGESSLKTRRFGIDEEEVAEWVEQHRITHETWMNELLKTLGKMISKDTMDYLNPQVHVIKGKSHEVIPNLVSEKMADLVVMGTIARTGISGLIIGNTAESILNNIECSVLAVKPADFVTPVTV